MKLPTLPGSETPEGTVHTYVYVPDGVVEAIMVALAPGHMVGELTVTTGGQSVQVAVCINGVLSLPQASI